MKADVLSIEGKPVRKVELPQQFDQHPILSLISRAVISDQTKEYQPKGNYIWAGMETSAKYKGRKDDFGSNKNKGMSRLPHEILPKGRFGRVRRIPSSVKGRRAHPPKVEETIVERMNRKEYKKALACAIAATADKSLVEKRGHKIADMKAALPLVLEKSFDSISKTKQVVATLQSLGLTADLERGAKRKARSGVGSRRIGGNRTPKSVLIIVGAKEAPIMRAGRNISGVDVSDVKSLSVMMLAPGTHAGRLTIYSETALEEMAKST
jgi:large subunit ribosomal protein L4e